MSNNCNQCGTPIMEGTRFCPACGAPATVAPPPPPLPNETTNFSRPPSLDQLISPPPKVHAESTSGRKGSTLLPTLLAIAGLLIGIVLVVMAVQQRNENAKVQQRLADLQKGLDLGVARMSQSDNRIAAVQSEVQVMQDHMGLTEAELKRAHALAAQLQAEQQKNVRALSSQIAAKADSQEVQTIQKEAETKFAGVNQDIDEVKQEVKSSQEELTKTKEELSRLGLVVNEQGTMIATNATGLEELRRKGERDYFTFDIRKKQKMTIAGVGFELRKADVKKQFVDFKLFVDDRTMEQKQIYVNRPINFYAGRERVPYEVVVNEVKKDQMVGYISVPKGVSGPTGNPTLSR